VDPHAPGPIGDALALLVRDGLVEARPAPGGGTPGVAPAHAYHVPRQRRAELDFFRNNVIHHFVAFAIIAAAQGAAPADGAETPAPPTLESDTRWLSRLFKLEFMYRVGIQAMMALGLADDSPDSVTALARDRLFLAQMVRPYADAYRAAVDTLTTWSGGDRRAFAKAALLRAVEAVSAHRALPESVSKTTLDNAAAWLAAEGAFTPGDAAPTDRQQVSADWRNGGAAALVRQLDRYRPRP
jgi:glycerol-3-phosphate O-acyltransferase